MSAHVTCNRQILTGYTTAAGIKAHMKDYYPWMTEMRRISHVFSHCPGESSPSRRAVPQTAAYGCQYTVPRERMCSCLERVSQAPGSDRNTTRCTPTAACYIMQRA